MRVLAVPVKSLERTKSRLSPLLSPAERAVLTLAMLEDVLDAVMAQPDWEPWVVSNDEAVLEIGVRRGARPLEEEGGSLLGAVRQVESNVRGRGSELAVVLADLSLLTAPALRDALEVDAPVVAALAWSDQGTNLLVRRPPSVIRARFGTTSFAKHRWAARRARVAFAEVEGAELSNDLDVPQDLETLLMSGRRGRTRTACLELGLPARLRHWAQASVGRT